MLTRVQRSYGKTRLRAGPQAPSTCGVEAQHHRFMKNDSLAAASLGAHAHAHKHLVDQQMRGPLMDVNGLKLSTPPTPLSPMAAGKPASSAFLHFHQNPSELHRPSISQAVTLDVRFAPPPVTVPLPSNIPAIGTGASKDRLIPLKRSTSRSTPSRTSPAASGKGERHRLLMRQVQYRRDLAMKQVDPRELPHAQIMAYTTRALERYLEANPERDAQGHDLAVIWPGRWDDSYNYEIHDE